MTESRHLRIKSESWQEDLRTILESSPVGMVVFDDGEMVIYANPQAEALFGKRLTRPGEIKCGDFITCANRHTDPQGCGHTPSCPNCPLFLAIRSALSSDQPPATQAGDMRVQRDSPAGVLWISYKATTLLRDGRRHVILSVDDITDRKSDEQNLKDALAELAVIHENAPIAMMILDPDRRVRKVNGFAALFAGRPAAEMIGMPGGEALRCLHHLDNPRGCGFGPHCSECRVRQAVLETFASGQSQRDIEAWLPFPDGETTREKCLLISTAHLRIADAERVLVCAQDITDRKRSEEVLRESEKRFRDLYEQAPLGYQSLDAEGRLVEVNRAWRAMLGYARADVIGHWFGEFLAPSEVASFKRRFLQFKTTGEVHADVRMVKRDGAEILVHVDGSIGHDEQGHFRQTHCILHDITISRRTEAALRESEEKFRLTFNSSPDAVNINRLQDGLYIDVNDGFTELTGYTHDDVAGKTSLDIDIWHDPADRDKLVRQLQQTGVCDNLEAQFRMKDGRLTTALMSARTISLNGEPHIISISRDISERKRYESERDITLNLLQFLHKKNDLSALIHDITALMQNWSGCEAVGIRLQDEEDYPYYETRGFPPAFVEAERQLCRYDQDGQLICDAAGNPLLECMCGNVIHGRFDPDLSFFTGNGSFWTNSTTDLLASTSDDDRQTTTRNRCHGQGYESVALIPLRMGRQRIGLLQFNDSKRDQFDEQKIALFERLASNLAIGLSQRITALALRESEGKYRSMLEAMDDEIYICSADLRIEYMNGAMIARVGRDATGEFCHNVIHGRDQKCPRCVHENVLRGESITKEIAIPEKDKTYNVSSSPIFHADGSVSKLTIFRDVSALKKMEARVQQAQKMEAIGALAGGIAHDFNNLLFPILGLSEMLLEDLPRDSSEHEFAEEIFKAGKRAGSLVKQILAFSRQTTQEKTPVRFQTILKEILKLARATIPSSIEIARDIQPDCGLVMADPTQLHQVAMNLITNAYHATEGGGRITVGLKEIHLQGDDGSESPIEPGKYALLTVSDTGCGIAPDIVEHIFEPYFTTKTQDKGTGLGLAVVYGIVTDHHGEIRVSSEEGQGTTFRVYLPLITKPCETPSKPPVMGDATGDERILIVDDEEAIARLEAQMLERLGYRITSRVSSLEALETFKANPDGFDMVITDMTMPQMTGDQLANELIAIRPGIPIILCTGFSERMNLDKAEAMSIKGYLMKPVTLSELAKTVREVLDRAKASG